MVPSQKFPRKTRPDGRIDVDVALVVTAALETVLEVVKEDIAVVVTAVAILVRVVDEPSGIVCAAVVADVTRVRVGVTVTRLEGFVVPAVGRGVVWAVAGNEAREGVKGTGVETVTIVAQGSGF